MHSRIASSAPLFRSALLALLLAASGAGASASSADPAAADGPYRVGPASRDGTGRFYMGREISQVMGHRGAGWLERTSREREERTDLLLEGLPLEPDDVVVDLGAGTGYFSLPIARRVPQGRVLAVDLQPQMLSRIRAAATLEGVDNIETVQATETDPRIPPGSADLALLVDAYHEFSHPREVMQGVVAGLRPGGRVFLVEYRAEDPTVPIKRLHKMTEKQAVLELEAVGLRWVETRGFLPRQHVLVFEKPSREAGSPPGDEREPARRTQSPLTSR